MLATLLLERYLCGEVTDEEKTLIENECRNNEMLREQLDEMRRSDSEIKQTYMPNTVADEIALKMHREDVRETVKRNKSALIGKNRFSPLPVWSYAVLVAVLLIVPITVKQYGNNSLIGERTKGIKPLLTVYRDEGKNYKKLSDNALVSPGDRLQIGYNAAGMKYGIILSVDGNGVLSLHYPEDRATKTVGTLLEQGGEQLLNTSFELDSAPHFERFYFLTSEDTLNVSEIITECEKYFSNGTEVSGSKIGTLPANVTQSTITLNKE